MRYFYFLLIITLFIHSNAFAASSTTTLTLSHPEIPEPLVFNVALPNSYDKKPNKKYILLFDFHPNAGTYLRGMHDWLSHNGEWPWLETIIVTPQKGNRAGMLFDASGKSTPLLDFFETELIPSIDKKYRTNGFRIISGFRTNATIVLSSLINKPHLFNAHIATSPELKDDLAGILSTAEPKLKALDEKPRFLLLAHGTNIKEEHQLTLYDQLNKQLQQYSPAKLERHFYHFKDNYFMSLPLLSVITGIEKLFDDIHNGLAPDSEIAQKGVQAIVDHYHFLSTQKYGFEVSPKRSITNLGDFLLKSDYQKALKVFENLVIQYPDDAYSYHHLAKAYASQGDYQTAVMHQQKAVKLAENMLTWHQKRHKRFLNEYISKTKQ